MANEQLARQYAQAVFEQAMAKWLTPLQAVAAALEKAGATIKLDDPTLAFSAKQELLRSLFPANTPTDVQNLIFTMATKNHVHLLKQVVSDLDRYAKREAIGATAKVTSAVTLTDGEKNALESKLRAQFGNDLLFDYTVDATILGGVVVRVGDKVIDGSVAGKLAALQEKLK